MLLKSADDKTKDIQTLEMLLRHPSANGDTRQRIERELRNIKAGIQGERETSYEIEFNFRSNNWMVIHDLRIEHEGRVAQIDHVLINRFLNVYVCESKRFSEGVAINEQGEFAAFFNHRPYGIPSPIEQNKRHVAVLEALFAAGVVPLPTRLGFTVQPRIESFVVVSKSARISRPTSAVAGLATVLKSDQFAERITQDLERGLLLAALTKLVDEAALERFARQLVALHKPIQFDWAAKFGLAAAEATLPQITPEPAPSAKESSKAKLSCTDCAVPVSYAVAKFCWGNRKFGQKIYCMACQKNH